MIKEELVLNKKIDVETFINKVDKEFRNKKPGFIKKFKTQDCEIYIMMLETAKAFGKGDFVFNIMFYEKDNESKVEIYAGGGLPSGDEKLNEKLLTVTKVFTQAGFKRIETVE